MTAAASSSLTLAAYEFLGEYAQALGNHALRCPAITVEAAREWATENGLAMKRMFLDGTFVEVDGEALTVETLDVTSGTSLPVSAPTARDETRNRPSGLDLARQIKQMRLGA